MRYSEPKRHLIALDFEGDTVESMTLGKRLREAIDAKNISHAWVAEQVGITPASLSSILTGKTADPRFSVVLGIARAIQEPLSAIVDDPLLFWSAEELAKLGDFGGWLVKRTTREDAGQQLDLRPQKRSASIRATVHPVAATSGGVLYPDAFELRTKRIVAKYKRMGADIVFSVSGESMTGADIHPGDLLYVHRTPETDEAIGRIVVCTVDDMVLVKRLRIRRSTVVLESAHPDHKPMEVDETSSRFHLIGIVVATART
ncbi:MAG TPA: LexA family transcriptional regulator [Thermoanaerobaculia bacterium]|nr:LexA family transcriptional regulator [Thermoanaerobaculia bacterium]